VNSQVSVLSAALAQAAKLQDALLPAADDQRVRLRRHAPVDGALA
jgi:hypothetical protein